jgi:hypothetical protein
MSKVRADNYSNRLGTGAPDFPDGLNATGVVTATSFAGDGSGLTGVANTEFIVGTSITMTSGNFTGNVTIGGTLTYQDVESIDSIGIITAQQGIQILANGLNVVSGVATVGIITGVTSVGGGVYYGDGSQLTGVIATPTISTDGQAPNNAIVFLDLSNAQDHRLIVSGITTISCTGGTEGDSHTVRIVNSGIATVGFTTAFLFPSGTSPSMPTADGANSLISFTINKAGAAGTELFAGASLNYS